MVKAKLLKQLRKKIEKAERLENPLSTVDKENIAFDLSVDLSKGKDKDGVTQGNDDASSEAAAVKKQLEIQCNSSADLSDELLQKCLRIFAQNMGDLYRSSAWGLDMEKKAEELQHRKARFLMVYGSDENQEKELACFCHFRFDFDDDESPECTVLYVYEIQIQEAYRRQGLGRRLMGLMEGVARQTDMHKVVLTVFKQNESAMQFYTKTLDYEIDDSSPSKYDEPADYEILSKVVTPR